MFGSKARPADLVYRARAMMGKGQPKAAAGLLKEAIKAEPGNMEAVYALGLAYNRLKKYSDAITCFDRMIEKNINDAPAHNNRSIALAELGNTDGALEGYKTACRADPKYAPALFNMGVLYDRLGDSDEALIRLDEAIKVDPKSPSARFYKGIVLGRAGRHEEALNCFEAVCRTHRRHVDAAFHRGIELAELDRHEEALKVFMALPADHIKAPAAQYALARSLASLNKNEEAVQRLVAASKGDRKTIKKWAQEEKAFDHIRDDPRISRIAG